MWCSRNTAKNSTHSIRSREDNMSNRFQVVALLLGGILMTSGVGRANPPDDLDQAKAEIKRLQEQLLRQEKRILELEKILQKSRDNATAAEIQARRLQQRIEELLEQVARLTKELAKVKGANPGREANAPNPPPDPVKGTITKIDKADATLVGISIGSDAGIALNHTLEVYRLKPKAEYLG